MIRATISVCSGVLLFHAVLSAAAPPPSSDPIPFAGFSALCQQDFSNATYEQKGQISFTYGIVETWRNVTDHEYTTGTETIFSNTKLNKWNAGVYWGDLVLVPDAYEGEASLIESFRFRTTKMDQITGTYLGTGVLEGVTVDYEATPMPPPWPEEALTACGTSPPLFVLTYSGYIYEE